MQNDVVTPRFLLGSVDQFPVCRHFRGRYALGLLFIVLVSIVWTVSSVLTQFLYSVESFDSPFLMTYLGVCLFSLLLPLKMLTDHAGYTEDPCCLATFDKFDDEEVHPTRYTEFGDGSSIHTRCYQASTMNEQYWSRTKHIEAAMHIAPVLFIANWAFNAALGSTSVASSTVLVSTSNVFVFVLAVLLKDEQFSIWKLAGVILGVMGTCLTALHDFQNHDPDDLADDCAVDGCDHVVWGDTLSLVAAVAYGAYAVQVRVLCPENEDLYSMQLLLGYIGLITLLPLLPFAVYFWLQVDMTTSVLSLIVVKGVFDFVISEWLHFRAVVLTNATTATVGLGLSIPLAFFADWVVGKANIASPLSLIGAGAVTIGFLMVNLGNKMEMQEIEVPAPTTNDIDVSQIRPKELPSID
jgi:solute carrier family 35 protein F5